MSKESNNFIVLDIIDSTNNYANHLISAGTAENGTVVLAHYQNDGRGQRENRWESAPGKNLLTSFVVFPTFLEPSNQFYLSKIASLAIVEWLFTKTTDISIKWPNDIYVGHKKIAGILIETSVQGNILYSAVVGTGLNLNQNEFNASLPNPVSLKLITGSEYDVVDSARELYEVFMKLYQELEAGAFEKIDTTYFNHLFRRNEWAWFREKGELLEARIVGIGGYGQLLLEDRTGNINAYFFKQIEFVV
jgi:BirA family transcriptional regulator, biotin operon repressor / biotin---[acetyl-CoA-carboxylase] ligase